MVDDFRDFEDLLWLPRPIHHLRISIKLSTDYQDIIGNGFFKLWTRRAEWSFTLKLTLLSCILVKVLFD